MSTSAKTILLLAATAVCLFLLPWKEWFGPDFEATARTRLNQRLASYKELRISDGWEELYKMTDPAHREKVDLARFLQIYATGAVKILDVDTRRIEVDPKTRIADCTFAVKGEMVPSKLPPQFRKNLQLPSDPAERLAALRTEDDVTISWIYKGGEWYFLMDREVLTGKSADGKDIVPLGDSPPAGNGNGAPPGGAPPTPPGGAEPIK
jgi:hypothetical protein